MLCSMLLFQYPPTHIHNSAELSWGFWGDLSSHQWNHGRSEYCSRNIDPWRQLYYYWGNPASPPSFHWPVYINAAGQQQIKANKPRLRWSCVRAPESCLQDDLYLTLSKCPQIIQHYTDNPHRQSVQVHINQDPPAVIGLQVAACPDFNSWRSRSTYIHLGYLGHPHHRLDCVLANAML